MRHQGYILQLQSHAYDTFRPHAPLGHWGIPTEMGKTALYIHLLLGIPQRQMICFIFIYPLWNVYAKKGVSQFGTTLCFSVRTFSNTCGWRAECSLKTAERVCQHSFFTASPHCKYRKTEVRLESRMGTSDHL